MTKEEATHRARELLAHDLVIGVSAKGDAFGQPSEERVEQLARLILDGEVK
jgi:hypothetical protein